MFCPNCKAEYREGFTKCSDCDAVLVETLNDANEPGHEFLHSAAPELLWSGTNSAALTGIGAALDNAKIPFHEVNGDIGPLPGLRQNVYSIYIHPRDSVAAHAALEEARQQAVSAKQDDDDLAAAGPRGGTSLEKEASQESFEQDSEPPSSYVSEDFDPSDATVEVWSGNLKETRDMLVLCFRENGIGTAAETADKTLRIRVMPNDQAKAREIVREVVEGAPGK
jgi:hypothetical protein